MLQSLFVNLFCFFSVLFFLLNNFNWNLLFFFAFISLANFASIIVKALN